MLYFPNTRIIDSVERAIVPSQVVDAEGAALVAVMSAGIFGVQLGSATATDKFAGVSLSSVINPTRYAYVEEFVVGAGATFTLALAPLANTLHVFNVTTSTVQVAGTPATTANQYSITGQVITFHAGQVGASLRVAYKYTPTIQQIRSIQGDEPAGRAASFTLGSIGVITRGDIMTSEFDSAVNWNAANPTVVLGAGGQFTIGGTGVAVPNSFVTSIPSPDFPFLGLRFSA